MIRPLSSSARSALVSTTPPRATFTSRAPSFIRARKSAPARPFVCSVRGVMSTTTSASGRSSGKCGDRMHGTALRLACGARDARHPRDLEGREPVLDGRTHRSVADDQYGLVGERGTESGPPLLAVLPTDEVGDAAQRGEDQGEGEFGGARVVHPARVAQPHALGEPLQARLYVVDTGGQGLHDLDGRHFGQGAHRDVAALHVGHDIEGAVCGIGGKVLFTVPEVVGRAFGEAFEVVCVKRKPHFVRHGQEAMRSAWGRRG